MVTGEGYRCQTESDLRLLLPSMKVIRVYSLVVIDADVWPCCMGFLRLDRPSSELSNVLPKQTQR